MEHQIHQTTGSDGSRVITISTRPKKNNEVDLKSNYVLTPKSVKFMN